MPDVAQRQRAAGLQLAGNDSTRTAQADTSARQEKWVQPLPNPVVRGFQFGHWDPGSNRFGFNVRGEGDHHQGIDLLAPIGTPVLAVRDGVITSAGSMTGFGEYVMLQFNHKQLTLYACYAHLSKVSVKPGDKVMAGMIIGYSGDSGNAQSVPATEKHLHFGISTSPFPTKMSHGKWRNPEAFMGRVPDQEKPTPAQPTR